jgi:hypothetical protein
LDADLVLQSKASKGLPRATISVVSDPTLPAPFRVYSGCDYDGCFWAIVGTSQDMTGWRLSVDHRGEATLYPFELGEAGQLSETELTINPYLQLPWVPAWLAFVGRGRAGLLVAPDGTRYSR